jgi:hypothetical protein
MAAKRKNPADGKANKIEPVSPSPVSDPHYSKAVSRIENAIRELEAGLRSATRVPNAQLTPSQISQRREVVESLERSLAGSRELLAQMQQLLAGPFYHPNPRKN